MGGDAVVMTNGMMLPFLKGVQFYINIPMKYYY